MSKEQNGDRHGLTSTTGFPPTTASTAPTIDASCLRVHVAQLKGGLNRTPAFEQKKLSSFAANIGTHCSHDCRYCSARVSLRMNKTIGAAGEDPFGTGFAVVDPNSPERLRRDARSIRKRGIVQLCTTVDAWAPEAQRHQIGRRSLEAILAEPGWTVRILTKNAAVARDFDLIERYRDRVLVGISLTGTPEFADVVQALEPNASPIPDRMAALREAHSRGLRTYGMLCPLLPGISDDPEQIDQLVQFAVSVGAEEVFAEPVNGRGPGLRLCQEALEARGYSGEAAAVGWIRSHKAWPEYAIALARNVQAAVRRHSDIRRLRFLLYTSGLTEAELASVRSDSAGLILLNNDQPNGPRRRQRPDRGGEMNE